MEPFRELCARSRGTVVALALGLGLRKVLDDPTTAAREWSALGDLERVRELHDRIWVYGALAVHDPVASGEIPAGLADPVRHTGHLVNGRDAGPPATGHRRPSRPVPEASDERRPHRLRVAGLSPLPLPGPRLRGGRPWASRRWDDDDWDDDLDHDWDDDLDHDWDDDLDG